MIKFMGIFIGGKHIRVRLREKLFSFELFHSEYKFISFFAKTGRKNGKMFFSWHQAIINMPKNKRNVVKIIALFDARDNWRTKKYKLHPERKKTPKKEKKVKNVKAKKESLKTSDFTQLESLFA